MFALAFRNLLRSRGRTAITLAAIAFGVVGLITSGGFVRDIFHQLGEALIHSQSGHAQLGQRAIFAEGSRSPERYLLADHDTLRAQLASQPEVSEVMARITFSGLLNNGKTDYAIIADGVEPERERKLGTHFRVIAGRMLNATDSFGAMIGEGVASALQLNPGDKVTILVSTIDGAMNTLDVNVVGIFQTFSKDFDARAIRISLADAQQLLDTDGASKLVVLLHHTRDTDSFVARMALHYQASDLSIPDWRQLNDFYEKTVDLYRQQFGFLKFMVLLMVCLSVINTVNMSLQERTWEFGTMRALGSTNKSVAAIIAVEAMVLGLAGATLGVLIGALISFVVSGVGISMPPPPNSDLGYDAFIRLVPEIVLESWVIGLLATVIASTVPTWRITRMSIIDELRGRE